MKLFKGITYQAVIVLNSDYPVEQLTDLRFEINGPIQPYSLFNLVNGIKSTSNRRVFLLTVPGSYTDLLPIGAECTYQIAVIDANLGRVASAHQAIDLEPAGASGIVAYTGVFHLNLIGPQIVATLVEMPTVTNPAENEVVSIPVSGLKTGDTVTHIYNVPLTIVGFYNSLTGVMEIPTQYRAVNSGPFGFEFDSLLGAGYENEEFNGKLICLKV